MLKVFKRKNFIIKILTFCFICIAMSCFSIILYANNETLKKRLEKRGDDKGEAERRLKHDNEDFKGAEYLADKIVYNNDGTNINDVVNKILEFIGAKNE